MVQTAGLLNSFLAAIQASLSVLLVIFYGAVAARFKLLDAPSAKSISKVSVRIFLPALLLTKIGSELHSGSAHRYLIILLWAFVAHIVSFLIGVAAHLLFGMPDWVTAAIMFNNTTSYPLLLIQSLDETGILTDLIITDESTKDAIERAKSYFLVFATVSSCLTFAVGPRLVDAEMAPIDSNSSSDLEEDVEDDQENEAGRRGYDADDDVPVSPSDHMGLLSPGSPAPRRRSLLAATSFFPSTRPQEEPIKSVIYDRRPSVISKKRWLTISERTQWWLLFLYDFLNAPLLGAVLGAIIGMVPVLHRAFFSHTEDGGIFSAWLTASLKNIGSLFVPLPVVIAGVSLYNAMQQTKEDDSSPNSPRKGVDTPWLTTAFVLIVRFVVWPMLSIGVIYVIAKKTDYLGNDPMLWFTMMLMPTGPPAMKLIAMVEVSNADVEDQHKISKLLTVSAKYSYFHSSP